MHAILESMARGWESKSVEAQQADVERGRSRLPVRTPEQIERDQRRHGLCLARARAVSDLARASAPAHRQMLERAIAALDAELESEP